MLLLANKTKILHEKIFLLKQRDKYPLAIFFGKKNSRMCGKVVESDEDLFLLTRSKPSHTTLTKLHKLGPLIV